MTDFANFLREILGIADYFMISEIVTTQVVV